MCLTGALPAAGGELFFHLSPEVTVHRNNF